MMKAERIRTVSQDGVNYQAMKFGDGAQGAAALNFGAIQNEIVEEQEEKLKETLAEMGLAQ